MAQIAQLKRKLRIKSEKSFLDLMLAAWGEVTAYPDPQKGWKAPAVKTGSEYLQHEPTNAIISTSSPVTSHIVAKELKEKYNMPWIADFRDLWTQNHYYPYSRFRKMMEQRLEMKTLSKADALVTVSQPASLKLATLHKDKQIHSVTNGFDPEELNMPEAELTTKFTITYTGNLYPGKQSPELLFAALKDLIHQGTMDIGDIEVRFYGAEAGWIDKQAERYGVQKVVKQFGVVPREVALGKQRESQLLLMMKWEDPKVLGAYSAKIFEYLAAKRPIIAIGGYKDVVDELLSETNAGVSYSTVEETKDFLERAYHEFQATRKVSYNGAEAKINKYSQKEMARKFAEILDQISL
jgi:glycosyltransferase involved in cell wall biosynthesis